MAQHSDLGVYMRQLVLTLTSLSLLFVACGGESTSSSDDGGAPIGTGTGAGADTGAGVDATPVGGGGASGGEAGGEDEALGGERPGSGSAATCRLTSSSANTTINGMSSEISTTCTWSGDVQTCLSEGPNYSSTGVTTFDCSPGWCQMTANETTVDLNGMTSVTSTTCTWMGLTQTCETASPATITTSQYNEHGVATSTQVEGEGFSSQSEMSYDCAGGWCKLLNTEASNTFNGMTTTTSTPCTWEGNTQRCEASDGSSTSVSTFNEQGAMISSETTGQGYSVSSEMSYECTASN